MDTRHNDLTGASIPPFAGVMDDDPVPDPADALSCTVPSAADSCAGAWIGAVSGGCPGIDVGPRWRGSVRWRDGARERLRFVPVHVADLGDYIEAESATLRATRTEYQYGADPLINVSIATT